MPDAGGISDQSNKAIQVFGIVDDISSECSKEKTERAAEKASRR